MSGSNKIKGSEQKLGNKDKLIANPRSGCPFSCVLGRHNIFLYGAKMAKKVDFYALTPNKSKALSRPHMLRDMKELVEGSVFKLVLKHLSDNFGPVLILSVYTRS